MPCLIHVLLGPAEWDRPEGVGDPDTVCVVFDVLRATSTIVTALAHGAHSILPVSTLEEALAIRRQNPQVLLAGERGGWPPGPELTGGVRFDFGNSPGEFTPERVQDRQIVLTTTNGSRALQACRRTHVLLAAAFLNLQATFGALLTLRPRRTLLVCAGTGPDPALEDILAAGALLDRLGSRIPDLSCTDAAAVAWRAWRDAAADLPGALRDAANARRLRAHPDLQADVDRCLQLDRFDVVVWRDPDRGALRRATLAALAGARRTVERELSPPPGLC